MIKSTLLLASILLLHSCATVPVTGRRQVSLVSSAEINQMSADQYQQVLRESKLSSNQEQVAM
ncbi:MAG TPA: M48 family peptidase, partial [Cyclobacteriaceae bacterium]|nr:M48 family peptidase [Cyclobacteriaceae bacterium]